MLTRDAAAGLMNEYARRIDDDRLEEWLDLFTEDCTYRIVPRENLEQDLPASIILCTNKDMLRDRIASLRHANKYNLHYDRHLITNVEVVRGPKGEWQIDANYAVFQTDLEGQTRVFSVGRYRDSVTLDGEQVLIREKLVIVDTFSVPTLLATPL
jgi:anthranilate 1,2-dioxygenase small subunit